MNKQFNLIPIFAYILSALFLCYEMGLQAATGVMTHDLMRDFSINAKMIGLMHAGYFIAYTAMQIPAGILFDKYSTRVLLVIAIFLCSIGCLIFAVSENFWFAVFARFLEGLGSAFAFVGTLVVAARWFDKKWFALLVGIAQALAAVGAMSAGAPLALAVNYWGWRETLIVISIFGLLLIPFIWVVLKQNFAKSDTNQNTIKNLKHIITDKKILYIAFYAFCSWGPITIFAELWGESFLIKKLPITIAYAGGMTAMIWVGLIVASPIAAWFSEIIQNRTSPAKWLAFLGIISTAVLIYYPGFEWVIWLCLFLFGVAASGQILTFAIINDTQKKEILGTAIGFINMALVAGGAILGPLASNLLHKNWQGGLINNAPDYQLINYQESLIIIPICYLMAFLIAKLKIKHKI